jgi:hypothetical protein
VSDINDSMTILSSVFPPGSADITRVALLTLRNSIRALSVVSGTLENFGSQLHPRRTATTRRSVRMKRVA